jgi:hypothetical protein
MKPTNAKEILETGFAGIKNTLTNCGDLSKQSKYKFGAGVGFDCHPFGCKFACKNGKRPSLLSIKCIQKGKRKILRPKKGKITC